MQTFGVTWSGCNWIFPSLCRSHVQNLSCLSTEPCQHRIKRLRSRQMIDNTSLFQQHYGRNTPDTEASRQRRAVLGIDLHYCSLAGQFFSYGSHHRCEGVAVRSGGSPELCQHRTGIGVDEGVKGPVGHLLGMAVQRRQSRLAVAATPT